MLLSESICLNDDAIKNKIATEINVGKVYNSYNDMIKSLDLKPCNGTQRTAQVKFIKRFIEYEATNKKRNQIVITKIHSPPLSKNYFRKPRTLKFQEEFEIILHYLLVSNNGKYLNNKMQLYYDCECLSKETLEIIRQDEAEDNSDYSKALNFFKNELFDICNKKAIYRLERYHSEEKIKLTKVYTATDIVAGKECVIPENDKIYLLIKEIEAEVIKEMNCKNMFHIIKSDRESEYYKKRNSSLTEKLHLIRVCPKIHIELLDFKIEYSSKQHYCACLAWKQHIKDTLIKKICSHKRNTEEKLNSYTENIAQSFNLETISFSNESFTDIEKFCNIENDFEYQKLKENFISDNVFEIIVLLINTL